MMPEYVKLADNQIAKLKAEKQALVEALRTAHAALSDPYCGEDDGKREAPVCRLIEDTLESVGASITGAQAPTLVSQCPNCGEFPFVCDGCKEVVSV